MTTHEQAIRQAAEIIERIDVIEQQLKKPVRPKDQLQISESLETAYRDQAQHKALYPWIWFSSRDIRGLVQACAGMAEKSYRRGIQQGEAMKVSPQDASWFRYECCLPEEKRDGLYRFSIPSPEDGIRRKIHRKWWSCVDLLDRELPYQGRDLKHPFSILRSLTDWYQKRFGRDAKIKIRNSYANNP